MNPARLLDTRAWASAPSAGSVVSVQATGTAGVPADADAVFLNVTAVDASGWGFVTVFPCGQPVPGASNLNYSGGQTIPNAVVAKPSPAGQVCLYTFASTDLLVDINCYST